MSDTPRSDGQIRRYDPIEHYDQGGNGLGMMREFTEGEAYWDGEWVRHDDYVKLSEITAENEAKLAEVTGERDTLKAELNCEHFSCGLAEADRDRLTAENAKLRAALEQMAAEWKIRMEDCESDRQRSITHRDDIAADESLSVFRAIKECHRELSEALRTGGAK